MLLPPFRFVAAAAFLAAPGPAAQTTVSVLGGQAQFTGDGAPGAVGGVALSHALSPTFEVDVTLEGVWASETSDAALLAPTPTVWNVRRHAVAVAGGTAWSRRLGVGATGHRVGLSGGVVARYRDDEIHHQTVSPAFLGGQPSRALRDLADEWEGSRDGREARTVRTGGGMALALTYSERRAEAGSTLGAAYELSVGRVAAGLRADYRWLLGQRLTSGTQTLDLTVRLGVQL